MKWTINTLTWPLICQHPCKPLTTCLSASCSEVSSSKKKCPYHLVWYRRLLTDVCWFEAMFNVPVKHAALYLIIRAHASLIGRWGAHEPCVCSGKLLNCFCVYIKEHATENISPSSRSRAQRIWLCAERLEKSDPQTTEPICELIKLKWNVLYFIAPFSFFNYTTCFWLSLPSMAF